MKFVSTWIVGLLPVANVLPTTLSTRLPPPGATKPRTPKPPAMPRIVTVFDTFVTPANRNCTCGAKPAAAWIVRLLSMSTNSAIGVLVAMSIVSPAAAPVTHACSVVLHGAAPG
jgi:hypothetical protein